MGYLIAEVVWERRNMNKRKSMNVEIAMRKRSEIFRIEKSVGM